MYQLIQETFPTARKTHRCIWCGESIPIGEQHRREKSKYEEFQDFRWHLECNDAAQEYFSDGESDFSAYENDRPQLTPR